MELILDSKLVIKVAELRDLLLWLYLLWVSFKKPRSRECLTHLGSKILDIRHPSLFQLENFCDDKTE